MRNKGWMVVPARPPGMFVRPEQVAEIGKRHPELGRLRFVVKRDGEADVMTLKAECTSPNDSLHDSIGGICVPSPSSAARSNWYSLEAFPLMDELF